MDFSEFYEESEKKWRYWLPSKESQSAAAKSISSYTKKDLSSGHKKRVEGLHWNCTGDRLGSCSSDSTIRVFKVESVKPLMELTEHKEAVTTINWEPSHPEHLLSGSKDHSWRMWDVRSGKCTHTAELKRPVYHIKWSESGRHIAAASAKKGMDVVDCWDARKLDKPFITKGFHNIVHGLEFLAGTKYIVQGVQSGYLDIISLPDLLPTLRVQAHAGHTLALDLDRKRRTIATGGSDGLVNIWDTKDMACIKTFARLDGACRNVALSHDAQFVAMSCYMDKGNSKIKDDFTRFEVCDVKTGHMLSSHDLSGEYNAFAWNPVQHVLAIGGLKSKNSESRNPGIVALFAPRNS